MVCRTGSGFLGFNLSRSPLLFAEVTRQLDEQTGLSPNRDSNTYLYIKHIYITTLLEQRGLLKFLQARLQAGHCSYCRRMGFGAQLLSPVFEG